MGDIWRYKCIVNGFRNTLKLVMKVDEPLGSFFINLELYYSTEEPLDVH